MHMTQARLRAKSEKWAKAPNGEAPSPISRDERGKISNSHFSLCTKMHLWLEIGLDFQRGQFRATVNPL